MKRRSHLLLLSILLLLMIGCGQEESKEAEGTPLPTVTLSPEITPTDNSSRHEIEDIQPDISLESRPTTTYYDIGEDIPSDFFPFKVTQVRFLDKVTLDTSNPEFGITDEGDQRILADDGHHWLCYSVDYKYAGKTNMNSVSSLFAPKVHYMDYVFDENYYTFIYRKDKWYTLSKNATSIGLPLPSSIAIGYEPLDDTEYVIRGIISVPDKL